MRSHEFLLLEISTSNPEREPSLGTADPTWDPESSLNQLPHKSGRQIGVGSTADVVTTDDPHVVRRHSRNPHLDSAYQGYQELLRNLIGSRHELNPYFPHVFKRGPGYDVELGVLFPIHKISDDALEAVLTLALGPNAALVQEFSRDESGKRGITGEEALSYFLDTCGAIIQRGRGLGQILDQDLRRALAIIRQARQGSRFDLDFKFNNVMFRLHPLHLVFTDPVF